MRYFLLLVILCACNRSANCQVISTYAGTGPSGAGSFGGDGGPANAAMLNTPGYIALDSFGNLYISDSHNQRIRKVNTAGIISTVAGRCTCGSGALLRDGTMATADTINLPYGITVDSAGDIYTIDYDRIVKINTAGVVSTMAGFVSYPYYTGDGGPATAAQVNPFGGISTVHGKIYFCQQNLYTIGSTLVLRPDRIRMIDAAGIIHTFAGSGSFGYGGDGGPATSAQIRPTHLLADNSGNVFIAEQDNNVVRKVSPSGIITTYAGTGVAGFSGDGGPATAAQLDWPTGMAVDSAGNLFIADYGNSRVRRVSPSGIITTIAGNGASSYGGDGGPATVASLSPVGVVVKNGCGERVYIAEAANNRIREIVYNNAFPLFAARTHNLNICHGSGIVNLNSMLTMSDADSAQTETWSLVKPSSYGSVSGGYVHTSTGGSLTPTGFSFTPSPGHVGADTFRIIVADCGNAPDTATFYVNYYDDTTYLSAGTITGPDTVCLGDTITLADATGSGTWSAAGSNITVLASGGVVGMATGGATAVYTISSRCDTVSASHAVYVKTCPSAVPQVQAARGLQVWPNPSAGELSVLVRRAAAADVSIAIYNEAGQAVKETTIAANKEATVKLAVPGIYLLRATVNGEVLEQTVVVK